MNNKELEIKIKEIIGEKNFFDMVEKATIFEKEYKQSNFFKITKMPILEVIKQAKLFYFFNIKEFGAEIQKMLNSLDMDNVNNVIDKLATTFADENNFITGMLQDLGDFKEIIKNNSN